MNVWESGRKSVMWSLLYICALCWLVVSSPASAQSAVYHGYYKITALSPVNTRADQVACVAYQASTGGPATSCSTSFVSGWNAYMSPNPAPSGDKVASVTCVNTATGESGAPTCAVASNRVLHYFYGGYACPAGTVENPSTHRCEEPAPACEVGAPPVYYIETSPPMLSYSPDALVCHGTCKYAYRSSVALDDGSVQNHYVPTNSECSGEETPRDLEEAAEVAVGGEDCNDYENVIMCFPPDEVPPSQPVECYDSGFASIRCPGDVADTDERCGFVAGDYYCLDADDAKSCGLVNGKFVCFPKGPGGSRAVTPVPQNSPDNPRFGGNADGREDNDVFSDSAEADELALSNDDVKRELQRLGIADGYRDAAKSRGGTAGSGGGEGAFDDSGIIEAVNEVNDTLNSGEGLEEIDGQGLDDAYAELADAIGGVGGEGLTVDADFGLLTGAVTSMLPAATGCQDIEFMAIPETEIVISVDTCMMEVPQQVLEWLLSGLAVFSLISIALMRRES